MTSLLEIKFIRAFCCATILIVGNLALVELAHAAAPVAMLPQVEESVEQQRYEEALEKTRELVKKCRQISLKFYDGSLAKSYQWKAGWEEVTAELRQQKPILEKAALEWFHRCEDPAPELVQMAGLIAQQLDEEGKFDLALKALRKIKTHLPEVNDVEFHRLLALLSIKTNRFEDALDFVNRRDARESVGSLESQLDINMFSLCPLLIDKWKTEEKIRQQEAKANDLPRVKLQFSTGDVEVELFENEAPETVANFISLIESGFYDGALFHPVVKRLTVQAGSLFQSKKDPLDYVIKNESRLPQRRNHFAGTLTMTNAENGKDSATVGFAILLIPNPDLDWNGNEDDAISQPAFGRVVSGIEHVAEIPATLEVDSESGEQKIIREAQPAHIIKATVIRKRDHEYTFEKRTTRK